MFDNRLRELREKKNLNMKQAANQLGIPYTTYVGYEKNEREPNSETLVLLADFFECSTDYLIGRKKEPESNAIFLSSEHIRMIPVFNSVSAGFGTYADNNIVGYIPCYIESDSEAADTICINVTGDSMFPKIEDGDVIQVHRQPSVDSGQIAVVLLDGDEGLVKKVVYDSEKIELHSINPMYPIQVFEKDDMRRIRIVGLVRKIIKNA